MDEIIKENLFLKNKIVELEEKIQKYTNNDSHKRYYEKHKETVKEKGKQYLQKLKEENPEKLKEYRRTAYLKRKTKQKEQTVESNPTEEAKNL